MHKGSLAKLNQVKAKSSLSKSKSTSNHPYLPLSPSTLEHEVTPNRQYRSIEEYYEDVKHKIEPVVGKRQQSLNHSYVKLQEASGSKSVSSIAK